jgi:acyl-CoA thioester hydrolase
MSAGDDIVSHIPQIAPDGLRPHRERVRPEWIDYNGHMNVAWYVAAFDLAAEAFLEQVGIGEAHRREHHCSTFTVEAHVTYQQEVHEGDLLEFRTRLLGFDAKRLHYVQSMYQVEEGYLAATLEWLTLYIDMRTRTVARIPTELLTRLEAFLASQAHLPVPPETGRYR